MCQNRIFVFLLALGIVSCHRSKPLFVEIHSNDSGIVFTNTVTDSDELNILDYLYYYNGGGVAAGDVNNDGLIDLFFVSNLQSNRLFLNKGNLTFEDITEQAHIEGKSSWNTGVTMVDINNDGWLDIYVCAVVGIHGFKGHNELYINKKDGTFKEEASTYGLDIQNYATSSAFFDYDKDGDLDLYLLNHGIHNTSAFFGVDQRKKYNEMSSDKLFRNDNGIFVDVTKEAKLFGGEAGYGLAIGVKDLNDDGWDDLYISNDFYEDDYLYINQKDGTFKEKAHQSFSQTSLFSMGNDIADINHDGLPDIITLDMLPEDERVLKNSLGEINYNSMRRRRALGYHDQFPRNHLQINTGDEKFMEIALFSGVAATDWSWAPVFGDFDNDGYKDLVISNGIYRRPNDADYIKYVSSDQIRTKINNTRLVDNLALEKMPKGLAKNYFFKGNKTLQFEDMSHQWVNQKQGLSNGMVAADFDNDGDLDLVFNNFNANATLLENKEEKNASLSIRFKGSNKNQFGIGTKVYAYAQGTLFYDQLHTTRGFLSSFPPQIQIGLGTKRVDSVRVVWPDGREECRYDTNNQRIWVFDYQNAGEHSVASRTEKNHIFKQANDIEIQHHISENDYPEFNREKLMPYGVTQEGAPIIAADVNGDNIDDLFFGAAKGYASTLFLSSASGYIQSSTSVFEKDKNYEDVDAIFTDIDADNDLDLFVISGGGEYHGKSKYNQDRVYVNDGLGNFELGSDILPEYYHTGSVVVANDFDNDGDEDYFVGSRVTTKSFGLLPQSFLLINNKGELTFDPEHVVSEAGMVTDARFFDYDQDGDQDLLVVGEWSGVQLFKNNSGVLENRTATLFSKNPKGLWQCVSTFDLDLDGIDEIVVGNVGLNTKFVTSSDHPLKMYVRDFDNNGQTESIVAIPKNGAYYSTDSKDKLGGQMPEFIQKKFNSYNDFAGKTVAQIFGASALSKSIVHEVDELQSGYFKWTNNSYTFFPFEPSIQWGPITKMTVIDIDKNPHLIVTGAKSDLPPYQGLWNAQQHFLISSLKDVQLLKNQGVDLRHKQVDDFETINIKNSSYLVVGIKNEPVTFFKY